MSTLYFFQEGFGGNNRYAPVWIEREEVFVASDDVICLGADSKLKKLIISGVPAITHGDIRMHFFRSVHVGIRKLHADGQAYIAVKLGVQEFCEQFFFRLLRKNRGVMHQDMSHRLSGEGFDAQEKADQDIGIDDDAPITPFH